MYSETEDVIRTLAENAEGVCRAYLPAGRREGSYWIVGDLQNSPGRSLFVRLTGPTSGPGAAGKFTDGATGEHGDLLDIIRERTGISRFPDLLAEARVHLGRPQPVLPDAPVPKKAKAPGGTPAAAARLFAASTPVAGTLADTYLRARGLTQGGKMSALRFHPKCWHRDEGQTRSVPRPALIAAVTDGAGVLRGVHRTWLAPDGQDKAEVETQRRAMGHLLGNAVRLTPHDDILVIGEGIETMLSLFEVAPGLPVWAALSSGHLGAVLLPDGVQRLKYFEDPALKMLHAGQAGSFPYPDEDGLRRDRQMTETRETVEKLKKELQEVRVTAHEAGTAGKLTTASRPAKETQEIGRALSGRARGKAVRGAAGGGVPGMVSFDLATLGLNKVDKIALEAAVQTTRAILSEHL